MMTQDEIIEMAEIAKKIRELSAIRKEREANKLRYELNRRYLNDSDKKRKRNRNEKGMEA